MLRLSQGSSQWVRSNGPQHPDQAYARRLVRLGPSIVRSGCPGKRPDVVPGDLVGEFRPRGDAAGILVRVPNAASGGFFAIHLGTLPRVVVVNGLAGRSSS